jgi:hypothetical protein
VEGCKNFMSIPSSHFGEENVKCTLVLCTFSDRI